MTLIDTSGGRPSPLTEDVRVVAVGRDARGAVHVSARVVVDEHNPVLAGHYPGLPIFPGVCLIECVHRTVLAAGRSLAVRPEMESVVSARFLDTTFPGEEIGIETVITGGDQHWDVTASLTGARGPTARIRLGYRLFGSPS